MTRDLQTKVNLVEAFIAKDGRLLIPAYTVQSVRDDAAKFTYWIVNLHDFTVADGGMLNIKLFHDEKSARAFATEQRGKPQ
jgi:hypothetical protein